MKKYFNSVDFIVFVTSIISLIWICFYKLFWSISEPLFVNADKWGDITYTVFSSIVAAGLFYLFTVFFPKIEQVRIMRKTIEYQVDRIYKASESMISVVYKSGTEENYSLDDFLLRLNDDSEIIRNDFISYYKMNKNSRDFDLGLNYQLLYIESIVLNYSNLLPNDIVLSINDYCNIRVKFLSLIEDSHIQTPPVLYYEAFFNMIIICEKLKKFIEWKWNNIMITQIKCLMEL